MSLRLYRKSTPKNKPTTIAPPLIDFVDDEPVNGIKEDLGDDELPEGVIVDTTIVVVGMYGDCELDCDVGRAPME